MVLVVKNLPPKAGDARDVCSFPGEGNGKPLQYSCLENLMDTGAWWATVPGITKSQTQLSVHSHTHRTLTCPQVLSRVEIPNPDIVSRPWRCPGDFLESCKNLNISVNMLYLKQSYNSR